MTAPEISVCGLVEVETDDLGWVTREAASGVYEAFPGGSGRVTVIVRGSIPSVAAARASAHGAYILGCALADAREITFLANGAGATEFAALVQAAVAKERAMLDGP